MAEWKYSKDPKTNARWTLANQMDKKTMESQAAFAQLISDTVPRKQGESYNPTYEKKEYE